MIEIFDDRVEITNPGSVPKGITKDSFGNVSVTRNPIIASLLHRIHYIERMGTGIKRMHRAMEAAGLKKPIFQTEGFFFKVIFERDLSQYDKTDVVNVVKDVMKESEQKIIYLIKHNGTITIPQMAEQLSISSRQVQRILKQLTDNGIIARIGGRRQGKWRIID
jgi:ATP-dependent DNA helicase RecG